MLLFSVFQHENISIPRTVGFFNVQLCLSYFSITKMVFVKLIVTSLGAYYPKTRRFVYTGLVQTYFYFIFLSTFDILVQ